MKEPLPLWRAERHASHYYYQAFGGEADIGLVAGGGANLSHLALFHKSAGVPPKHRYTIQPAAVQLPGNSLTLPLF
jgi:hypothetical protein